MPPEGYVQNEKDLALQKLLILLSQVFQKAPVRPKIQPETIGETEFNCERISGVVGFSEADFLRK